MRWRSEGVKEEEAWVALGANLEIPQQQIQHAFIALGQLPKTKLVKTSSLYRSAAIDTEPQPDYVNAVAMLQTALSPQQLLALLLEIEQHQGRERRYRNAPRTLDLDLLTYDDLQLTEHHLVLPHPRMHLRAFVLRPLLEIAPDFFIPGKGRAQDWLLKITDQRIEKLTTAQSLDNNDLIGLTQRNSK